MNTNNANALVSKYTISFHQHLITNKEHLISLIHRQEQTKKDEHLYSPYFLTPLFALKQPSKVVLDSVTTEQSMETQLYLQTLAVTVKLVEAALDNPSDCLVFGATSNEQQDAAPLVASISALLLLTHYLGIQDFNDETMTRVIILLTKFGRDTVVEELPDRLLTVLQAAGSLVFTVLIETQEPRAIH